MRGVIVGIMILSGLMIFGYPTQGSARLGQQPCTCGCGDLEKRVTELESALGQIKERCKCLQAKASKDPLVICKDGVCEIRPPEVRSPEIQSGEVAQPACKNGSCARQPIIQRSAPKLFRRFRNG